MTRLLCFMTVCALAATPASADEFWVSYQGNDFSENEGWERTFSEGGAIRTFKNGALVLDSLRSNLIVDFYQMFGSSGNSGERRASIRAAAVREWLRRAVCVIANSEE